MVFSVNQVRQLYVVDAVPASNGAVTESSASKTIALKEDASGENIYFQYKGADNLMRSDLINKNNILYAKYIKADADTQVGTLKKATVKLDANVNGGAPIVGQDYILRICINPYIGMSDEEPYFKYGAVHVTRGMKTGKFYTMLAASLFKNFSRELEQMLTFTISGKIVGRVATDKNGSETLYDTTGAAITVADDYADGIIITEANRADAWVRGIKEQGNVNFEVIPTTVTYDGDEVRWGTVTEDKVKNARNNGRKIADLEYFCMGERGDQYRNIGWPNVIPTKYLVDPDTAYNILEIHYAYVGPNEGPQKSEKDIVLVCPQAKATVIEGIKSQLETKTGITVEVPPKETTDEEEDEG